MSGYDVKQFLDRTVAHFWNESYGQIYPTLKHLEADGLVEGRDNEDGRGRRVYTLTALGLDALRGWLTETPQPDVPRYEMSLKLFFADQLPLDETLAHLRVHRERHATLLNAYREKADQLSDQLADSARLPFWLAVVDGGIRYSELVVEWCDQTIAALAELNPADYPAEPDGRVVPHRTLERRGR